MLRLGLTEPADPVVPRMLCCYEQASYLFFWRVRGKWGVTDKLVVFCALSFICLVLHTALMEGGEHSHERGDNCGMITSSQR